MRGEARERAGTAAGSSHHLRRNGRKSLCSAISARPNGPIPPPPPSVAGGAELVLVLVVVRPSIFSTSSPRHTNAREAGGRARECSQSHRRTDQQTNSRTSHRTRARTRTRTRIREVAGRTLSLNRYGTMTSMTAGSLAAGAVVVAAAVVAAAAVAAVAILGSPLRRHDRQSRTRLHTTRTKNPRSRDHGEMIDQIELWNLPFDKILFTIILIINFNILYLFVTKLTLS